MKIANILLPLQHSFLDYPNPIDGCISIFMSGCNHKCLGCQNKDLWKFDYNGSTRLSVDGLIEIITIESDKWRTNKIALMGGDPCFNRNLDFTKELLLKLTNLNYETILYTGYSKEFIIEHDVKGWTFLKCGKYDESLKRLSEKTSDGFQLASSNQEIYDKDFSLLSCDGFMKFN